MGSRAHNRRWISYSRGIRNFKLKLMLLWILLIIIVFPSCAFWFANKSCFKVSSGSLGLDYYFSLRALLTNVLWNASSLYIELLTLVHRAGRIMKLWRPCTASLTSPGAHALASLVMVIQQLRAVSQTNFSGWLYFKIFVYENEMLKACGISMTKGCHCRCKQQVLVNTTGSDSSVHRKHWTVL